MQKNAILRLLAVFLISISVLAVNSFNIINKKIGNLETSSKKNSNNFFEINENNDVFEQKPQNETSEKVKTEAAESKPKGQNKTSSVEVSAKAVKGKVIEKYISPYSAPNSYNGVYMKNSTDLDIDIKKLLSDKLSFKITETDKPQVLIIHTHTTETFMNEESEFYTEDFESRSRDNTKNMAEIGKIVAEKLNNAGVKTLHDKTQHDYPNYSGSYSRAAETISSYLKKYPTIKVVLDLHRDAVSSGESDKVKLVTEINGKKAAQVMLVMGSQSGTVTNFPNWKENLKLALRLQQILEVKYPTLARPLSLMSKNYNESLSKGSMLIEFGTDVNTLEEAKYSASLVSDALVTLLNNIKE